MKKGGNKNKGSRKAGRRGKDNDAGGRRFTAVPWNQEPLTDRMLLPRAVGGVYTTRKVYAADGFLQQSSTLATYGVVTMSFANNCTDNSSLAAVFDQYRIVACEVIVRPVANMTAVNAQSKGFLHTVIDYDDGTALTSLAQAQAYENCISTPVYYAQRRCFKPRVALAAYGSGAFTSYANFEAPWIDAASPNVTHYGVKFAMDIGNAGELQAFDLVVNTIFEFRASR
jgi:hypothetical protein